MFDIYLHEVRVGTLEPRGRGIRFTYASEALENQALPALSLALPKQPEPFPDSKAGPFFRNLLPEQAYRRLIAAAAGTTPENNLALLGAIGGECPGAISIWPAGTGPSEAPEYHPLSVQELSALFTPGDPSALANAISRGRLSLPGVQEKIALLRSDRGSWHLPLNGAVTSHILKRATPAFSGLLENELFCMALAGTSGLQVASTGLADPAVRVFCAERFDRVRSREQKGPQRTKVHQEDFCQILRTEPERKYEFDGGPGLKRCADVIRRYSGLPAADLERLVRWVGFNYLIGNEDAHAKNLALLYGDDGLQLTPHYDLASTEVYPQLQRNLAMKIGGASDIRNIQRSDWERFAKALGLPAAQVRIWILDQMEAVSTSLTTTAAHCTEAFGDMPIYRNIMQICEGRARQLERELVRAR